MKNLAIVALVFFSPLLSADDSVHSSEFKLRQVKIVLEKIDEVHIQNPINKKWYYVGSKKRSNKV
jgi:hypothetical protein